MFKNIFKKFKKKSPNYKKVKNDFEADLNNNIAIVDIEKKLKKLCKTHPQQCVKYKKAFFVLIKDIDLNTAVKYGEEVIKEDNDKSFIKVLAIRYKRLGNEKRYNQLMNKLSELPKIRKRLLELVEEKRNFDSIEKYINLKISENKQYEIKIKELVFAVLKDIYTKESLKYGEEVYKTKKDDEKFQKVLEKRYEKIGNKEGYEKLKLRFSELPKIRKRLLELVEEKRNFDSIEKYINLKISENQEYEIEIKEIAFAILKDVYTKESLKYGEEVYKTKKDDEKFQKVLEKRYERLGYTFLDSSKPFKFQDFKIQLSELLVKKDIDAIEKYIEQNIITYANKKLSIAKTAFSVLKDDFTIVALKYGEIVIKMELDPKFIKVLLSRAKRVKDGEKVYRYSKLLYEITKDEDVYGNIIEYENSEKFEEYKDLLKENEIEKVENEQSILLEKYEVHKDKIYYLFAELYYPFDKQKAINCIGEGLKFRKSDLLYLKLFEYYIQQGNLNKAVDSMPKDTTNKTLLTKIDIWKGNIKVLNDGFPLDFENKQLDYEPSNKILYLLHNTLPFHSGGYATRAHGLMEGTNSSEKFIMQGVSRLGYPKDILKLSSDEHIENQEEIDGIMYHRLKSDTRRGNTTYYNYIKEYGEAVVELAKREKPFAIHAASNLYNGLACVYAAKKLGIKSIYEIRGLWEITRISREPEWLDTDMYKFNADMETIAALNSDVVITITEALKNEMISRGVPADKIKVLPNGVVSDRFKPLVKNNELAKKLNLEDKTVIGFIGSFVQYEGLNYLVDAVKILVDRGITNLGLLMVGDGAVWEETKERVSKLNLDEYFVFTGRVPHEEVEEYYSLVDIAPFPRKGLPVCEMVSPLKPFEAMAMEKAVLSSNVAALEEIVKDGYNGLLFEKDNVEDFADKLEILINDDELRAKLGKQAREWVIKERDWGVLSKKLIDIYEKLREGNLRNAK